MGGCAGSTFWQMPCRLKGQLSGDVGVERLVHGVCLTAVHAERAIKMSAKGKCVTDVFMSLRRDMSLKCKVGKSENLALVLGS